MSNDNKKRFIHTIMSCFKLKNEVIDTLTSDLSEKDKAHLQLLKSLLLKEQSEERQLEYKERKENNKEFKFNTLRSCFKLETIVEKCCKGELDFPYLDKPEGFFQKKKSYLMSNLRNLDLEEEELENKVIVFVVGGVSINEIVALEKMMKEGSFGLKLIVGSTCIHSPESFMEEIVCIDGREEGKAYSNYGKVNDGKDGKDGNDDDSMIKTNQINPHIV